MEKVQLQRSANWSLFEMNKENRLVHGKDGVVARKDLFESLKQKGFLPTHPLICTKQIGGKLLIVDGHNRYQAARILGIPVYYLAYSKSCEISPMAFSQGQKNWTFSDKAAAISRNNPDYEEVLAYCRRTGIAAGSAFSMFGGQLASSNNVTKSAGNGDFKIVDRAAPEKVAVITEALRAHCSFSTAVNLVYAVCKAIHAEGFSVARMVERIGKHPECLKQCRSADNYIDMLELIYNRNSKSERYYLKTEIEKAVRARSVLFRNKD